MYFPYSSDYIATQQPASISENSICFIELSKYAEVYLCMLVTSRLHVVAIKLLFPDGLNMQFCPKKKFVLSFLINLTEMHKVSLIFRFENINQAWRDIIFQQEEYI